MFYKLKKHVKDSLVIHKQQKEILELKESNLELRSEHDNYLILKYKYSEVCKNFFEILLNIKKINKSTIAEKNNEIDDLLDSEAEKMRKMINELDTNYKRI